MFLILETIKVLASYFEYWYFVIVLFKTHQKCLSSLQNQRNELKRNYLEMPGDWLILRMMATIEGHPLEKFKDEMRIWLRKEGMKVICFVRMIVYLVYMIATFCLLLSLHNFLKNLIIL